MILNRAKQFAYIRYTNKESMLAAIKGENGENYKVNDLFYIHEIFCRNNRA